MVEISQNFVAFSEYMNFTYDINAYRSKIILDRQIILVG